MKIVYTLATILVVSVYGVAQELPLIDSKFYLFISGGVAIPVNGMDEYCDAGLQLKLNTNYHFTEKFSMLFSGFYTNNPSKKLGHDDKLFQLNSEQKSNVSTNFLFSSDSWQTFGVLVGPGYSLNGKCFSITFRVMTGIQFVKSPEISIDESGYEWDYYTSAPSNHFRQSQHYSTMSDVVVPLSFGYSIDYNISKNLFAVLDFGFLSSVARLKGIETTQVEEENQSAYEKTIPVSYVKDVAQISMGIGLGYRF